MPLAGFEPRNPSNRASADPHLRPLGQWDRRLLQLIAYVFSRNCLLSRNNLRSP